ncbi:mitochondrial carrier homolog 2 [Drosophila rhopaloa]|uniref:Mitochondrial carrier homolog 2 n=1 Tax=Drosophila rhopaloa TaxID=1041015 RepID=A0ABM5JE77_DRORH|nr:mitochondrial carrier homolog 2 [Drosophila rhopaloa]
MAHMEYNRRDAQAAGFRLGLGGGDADNSALMRRPTVVVQRQGQRTEPVAESPVESPRSMRPPSQQQAGRDRVVHCRGSPSLSLATSTTTTTSTSLSKSTDHGRPNQVVRFCLRLGYNALLYPYEFAKVLIQLGHEPLQARPFHLALFHRRPRLFLPGVHRYVQHIQQVDGYLGAYRGLTARLAACTVDFLLGDVLLAVLHFGPYKRGAKEELSLKEFWWNLTRDSIRLATAVALSQPFYVVMVRQIAQFVGRERVYEGVLASLMVLLKSEGYAGLFAGIVPRLLGEWAVLAVTSCVSHLCQRLLPMSRNQQQYNAVIIQMLASLLMYPLEVTSACMAVTGAPLAACEPPSMPLYNHWADCLTDLYARGGHNRGAILFWRTVPRIQLRRRQDGLML